MTETKLIVVLVLAAWADVNFMRTATHRRHQTPRLIEGARARGKAWHGVRQDVGARQAQTVHGLPTHQQRVG